MHGPYIYYVHSRFHSIWFSLDWFGWIELKSQNISLHLYRFGWVRRMKRTSCAIKRERETFCIKLILHNKAHCTHTFILPERWLFCTRVYRSSCFATTYSMYLCADILPALVSSRYFSSSCFAHVCVFCLLTTWNHVQYSFSFSTSVFHFLHMSARELVCKCMQLCTLREKEREHVCGLSTKRSLTAQMMHCKMPSKKISSRASHTVENE